MSENELVLESDSEATTRLAWLSVAAALASVVLVSTAPLMYQVAVFAAGSTTMQRWFQIPICAAALMSTEVSKFAPTLVELRKLQSLPVL